MTNKVRALLIGIDAYETPVRPLAGCVNDVERFHGWLTSSIGKRLAAEVLINRDATRANVLKVLREHLGRAEAGDVVLLQYCGHGAQSGAAPEFREFYPDGLDEGIVLVDSRSRGGHDLADKELALLIAELAQKDVHLAFILDSCHSGSATRSVDAFAGFRSRLTLGDTSQARPLETYLDGAYKLRRAKGQSLRPSPGRHMLLAACDRGQEAKESTIRPAGVFSTTLMDVLERSGGNLSYADLFVRCRATVRKLAQDQDPQFEPIGGFDAWSGFLGGAAGSRSLRHSVFFDDAAGAWKVDAGAIHGLGDAPDRAIGLALYDENDPSRAAGTAHTIEIGAQSSMVMMDDGTARPTTARFRAALTTLPAAPLLVYTQSHQAGQTAMQAALDGAGSPLGASGVLLSGDRDGLRYGLSERDGALVLEQIESGVAWGREPIGAGGAAGAAVQLLPRMLSIAKWERLLGLRNRASDIRDDQIDLVLIEETDDGAGFEHADGQATLESTLRRGEWQEVRARVKMRNRSGSPLHAVLLHFAPNFQIQVLSNEPVPVGDAWITLWGDSDDQNFYLDVGPDGGVMEALERFKLLVSTEQVDSFHFEQPALTETPAATKGIGTHKASRPRQQDWLTKDLRVRVVPRIDGIGEKAWQSADGSVTIRPHRRLRANLGLATANPATRGPGEVPPFVAAFASAKVEIAAFGRTRATADAQSVIELTGIQGAESLKQEPLEIEVRQKLAKNETLLAFAWDGQHVVPCGDVARDGDLTRITIDAIPETRSDRRSLGGALKLYFFKTYLKHTDLNRLRWIDYRPDGSWAYREDGLQAKVAEAHRVLLIVHGIIGDTEGMAAGARQIGLHEKFDLVLTYDYENLDTKIANTARELKRQLAEIGLTAGDGRHLTLLVHSMGGLVSRWFIEREGGNEVVDRLVMCGTPNNGSPFGKVDSARKILGTLMGLAANYMPAMIPFAAPTLTLLARTQKLTATLEQMDPDSDFIRELNESPDPGIPYTIIAGNVDEYREPTDDFFVKLIAKTGQSFVFDALFASKANDIAVSIDSITRVGVGRATVAASQQVACHHLNYFVSAAGQQALKSISW